MANKVNYKRVMALGAWLEKYIVSLSHWNIEQLADDAIKLMNVDYERLKADLVITAIKKQMEPDSTTKCMIEEGDLEPIMFFIKDPTLSPPLEQLKKGEKEMILSDIRKSIYFVRTIPLILKDMLSRGSSVPWEYSIALQERQIFNEYDKDHILLEEYNNIRELLIVKDDGVKIVNKMVYPDSNNSTWVRLPALICRIFITFLQEGGRDYCTLCKNCGKFILAERKGRRHFCGGACRIAYKREKDREAIGKSITP